MDPDFNGTPLEYRLVYDEATGFFQVFTKVHLASANPNSVAVLVHDWNPSAISTNDLLATIIDDANTLGDA